ncbi:RNA polymerase sigma factor [Streptomyces yaizuensis]|uniref:Sigma-70 family RNA polymerase sigma factor n=1 Tax=Streptomyces yaizuensis TaxID=2989713 RepID=A0ABQ5P763_9ACTN|nr:sigma-70 family RNA polymerase sigma factor [Streptomyces sp. YSPA8]GLF98315.1 sigma-70 family RNA polymerase sigma factor [Streptomyces sp. YSPA8]
MADEADRFTAVYDACRGRVWAYVVSRAGRQVADEVVSETFTVAWRRRADLPADPLPWLLGVARNVLRDTVRAEVRRESLAAEFRDWTERSAPAGEGDVADAVADRNALLTALATLADEDREILVLTAWHGLKPAEAARVVGCSAATLRVRLHRARKRLTKAADAAPAPLAPARPAWSTPVRPVRVREEV